MKVIDIMLAEDDELDVIDIQRSLNKINLLHQITVARNGEEAISILESKIEKAEALPDIIIIDINMPRMNGLELLEKINESEKLKDLKRFILTTSEEMIDKITAEELGVSGYLTKPLKLNNPGSIDEFNLMIDLMNLKN